MLFEQKSRRKSSVEIAVYPYKSLTRHYFFIKISSMISSASYKRVGWPYSASAFFYSKDWSLFLLMLFRPSKMVAEIYWQTDGRDRSRR
jgi:hypothetical protein